MKIFKYTLMLADKQTLDLPLGAKILSIQNQYGQPRLWAMVDDTIKTTKETIIHMVGTGHDVPDDAGKFHSTIQLGGGSLVFHFFIK